MRYKTFLVTLSVLGALVFYSVSVEAKTVGNMTAATNAVWNATFGSELSIPAHTYATRPTAPSSGSMYLLTDAVSSTDCTQGGGGGTAFCMYNGSAWIATTASDSGIAHAPSDGNTYGSKGGAWERIDYNNLLNLPMIPTATSELTNDSGFLTSYTETDPTAEPALGNPSVDGYVISSTIAGVRSWIPKDDSGNVYFAGGEFDGVTDDTAAIQATIDQAHAAGGGIVEMPAGTAKISTALILYDDITLRGQGMNVTTLETTATSGALAGGCLLSDGDVDMDYVHLEGFRLHGHGETQTSGSGILFDYDSAKRDIQIHNVLVEDFPDYGIYVARPILSDISYNRVSDTDYGIYIDGGTSTGIKGNHLSSNKTSGLYLDTVTYAVVENNAAEYNTVGYTLFTSRNIVFDGNGGEMVSLADGGTTGYVAHYVLDNCEFVSATGDYSSGFWSISTSPAYHWVINNCDNISLNEVRGTADGATPPTNTVTFTGTNSEVLAKNVEFTDAVGGGLNGSFDGTLNDIATKEDSLGNPTVDGYVLASTISGTRSWVAAAGGSGISHAPSDGNTYGSKDGVWARIDYNNLLNIPSGAVATGLEVLDEGNGDGWRLIGRDPDYFGNIGVGAVDFSDSLTIGTVYGAVGNHSVAFGSTTRASGIYSFATGVQTNASGYQSNASGSGTEASGQATHSEGYSTVASALASHAEGQYSLASGTQSHAEGLGTKAINQGSHAEGTYNVGTSAYTIHETGIGTGDTARINAFEIYIDGTLTAPNATLAEIASRGDTALVTKEYADSVIGGGAWGSITGTLSAQTDLQTELDAKQDTIISTTDLSFNDAEVNSLTIVGTNGSHGWTVENNTSDVAIPNSSINQTAGTLYWKDSSGVQHTVDLDGSGVTDADAIHDNVAGEISLITTKATPTTSDLAIIEDNAAANGKKKITLGSLPISIATQTEIDTKQDAITATTDITMQDLDAEDITADTLTIAANDGYNGWTVTNNTVDTGIANSSITQVGSALQWKNSSGTKTDITLGDKYFDYGFPITSPAATDDVYLYKTKTAQTLTGFNCIAVGGGTITVDLKECSVPGTCTTVLSAAVTADSNGEDATLSDTSIASGAYLYWDLGAPTGTVNSLTCTLSGKY